MNYAIIELGGKQYRVEKGDSVVVDRIDAKEGAKVSPKAVLFRSDRDTVIDGPDLEKVKVEAVVAEHVKGPRIRVFKYRAKKRYRRTRGHRSHLTRLEISDVSMGTAARRPPATKKEPADKPPAAEKAPARKPAQRKAPARKPSQPKKEEG